jgi:ABC-2 type transport system ATP-binding protein
MVRVTTPAIATTGLTRRFGEVHAVEHLDLAVPAHAVYGFLGPNGAGKTTTIRLLLGLARADTGDVRLLGASLNGNRPAVLRQVGALVESPSLYPHLTGRENLEVTRRLLDLPRPRIDAVLDVVGLRDAAHRRAGDYSLGMRQRLGLALALLPEPKLLILDEPTNGLDPQGIQEVRALVRGMPARFGVTVFLSSHLLGEVEQIATHIGVIHRGTLRFQGALAELEDRRHARLTLGVDRPAEALALLGTLGFAVAADGERLRVGVQDPRAEAARIVAALSGAGIGIWHVAAEQRSLEELFLAMTGEDA